MQLIARKLTIRRLQRVGEAHPVQWRAPHVTYHVTTVDALRSTPPSHAVHAAIEIAWTRRGYGGGWRSDDWGANDGRDRDRTGHTAPGDADGFAIDDGAGGSGGDG